MDAMYVVDPLDVVRSQAYGVDGMNVHLYRAMGGRLAFGS